MKNKEQREKEARERRRREDRARLQVQKEVIGGIRHPSGLPMTEGERWTQLHPDEPRY